MADKMMSDEQLIAMGQAVIETELSAVRALLPRIDAQFSKACHYMLNCEGRVVVLGMGKSGHIGGKLAATLASTGTPAFFVHPGEASHGDLGMIIDKDVVLAISNSGETDEILTLLPLIKRMGVPLIAFTGNQASTLARAADVPIDVGVEQEACPLGLAPTSSTTATLVMGDALAISLLEARGFTSDDFAKSHPGGRLGRRLLVLIKDVMHTGAALPCVDESATLSEALIEMTKKGLGMTAVVDKKQQVIGIFTDGDLRRALDQKVDTHVTKIGQICTRGCQVIRSDLLAAEALKMMEDYKINAMLVVDENDQLIGAFNMHDLLRAGVL